MPWHRALFPIALTVSIAGLAQAQPAPPPAPPAPPTAKPAAEPPGADDGEDHGDDHGDDDACETGVVEAIELAAGEPTKAHHRPHGEGILKERLLVRYPDLTIERFRLPEPRIARRHLLAMTQAVRLKGPRYWGAQVLLELRGSTIVRLRGSRLKIDAVQTRRIRDAAWTGVSATPHDASERHVFLMNPSGTRYFWSFEKRTPRKAGRFANRLQHAVFKSVYLPLAKAHDASVLAPTSVTSLQLQGERTIVIRRTLYPEVRVERRRLAPQTAIARLQTLEDGLDLPLIRTPEQVQKNEPPGRIAIGIDAKVQKE